MAFDLLERGLYWLSSFVLEGDVEAHCQIGCPLDETIVLTVNNDLFSVVEIRGSRRLMGAHEFELMAENLSIALSKVLKSANGSQHSFAMAFRSSPGSSKRLLGEILGPNLNTAKRFGAHDTVMINDQIGALASKCKEESIYLIVYTHASGLSPSERERAMASRAKALGDYSKANPGMRLGEGVTQTPQIPINALIPRHASAVENLLKDLQQEAGAGGVGILADVMDVASGLAIMRRHLDASNFEASWRPRLLGDKSAVIPSNVKRRGTASHLYPMRIGRQLVSDPIHEVFGDIEYSKRGGIYYAGVVIDVPPEDGSMPFSALAQRIGRQIPWTMNMELVPNGLKLRKFDQNYAAFFGAMGDANRRVKDAWEALKNMQKEGVYISGIRVALTTWGSTEQEITTNLSFLKSSVESWGSSTATNETGAPGLLSLCAAAGYSKRMPAGYLPGPISEFSRMMPMFPPASVWTSGQLVAHTADGRPYPVGLGTTMQSFWGTLIFAPSGSGKSFLMNMINAGIIFAPGLDELPYLTVIDVGPSSRLVMDLAKSVLPEHLARQVVSIRIRNTAEYSINPFDTQLGCDRPTEVDRDFQVSVVSTVCPGLGPEGERFIGQVIDEAYRTCGRMSPSQRRWQNSMDDQVYQSLINIGFETNEKTFVWEVVDALFDAGLIDDASLAQRYAVPRMPDLIKASRSKEILDAYGDAPSASRESILDVFTRNIQTAQSEYELISGVTRFEVGNARVMSIDLEEFVTGSDSEEGRRRAAMMFLFARRLGAKNYFLRWDEIKDLVPDRYVDFQQQRVKGLEESIKFLEYDEAHYASGIPAMSRRMQEDLRVGRKYKCITMMASQLLQDFPRAAVDNCYTYFILGAGTDTSLDELQTTFGLTASETAAIKKDCNEPGRLFGLFKTVKGTTSQILYTTAGPFTRWAYSSSKDDALLRTELTNLMDGDYLTALKMLSKAFPSGSARDEMDRYRRARTDAAGGESIITVFAQKVLSSVKVAAEA